VVILTVFCKDSVPLHRMECFFFGGISCVRCKRITSVFNFCDAVRGS